MTPLNVQESLFGKLPMHTLNYFNVILISIQTLYISTTVLNANSDDLGSSLDSASSFQTFQSFFSLDRSCFQRLEAWMFVPSYSEVPVLWKGKHPFFHCRISSSFWFFFCTILSSELKLNQHIYFFI